MREETTERRRIQVNTNLFTIPARALINSRTLSSFYPATKSGIVLTANQMITLHLLLHRPVGEHESLDPKFGPFISTMPREFDSHPLTWLIRSQQDQSDAFSHEIYALLPPSVDASVRQAVTRFWGDWKAVCAYSVRRPHILAV